MRSLPLYLTQTLLICWCRTNEIVKKPWLWPQSRLRCTGTRARSRQDYTRAWWRGTDGRFWWRVDVAIWSWSRLDLSLQKEGNYTTSLQLKLPVTHCLLHGRNRTSMTRCRYEGIGIICKNIIKHMKHAIDLVPARLSIILSPQEIFFCKARFNRILWPCSMNMRPIVSLVAGVYSKCFSQELLDHWLERPILWKVKPREGVIRRKQTPLQWADIVRFRSWNLGLH